MSLQFNVRETIDRMFHSFLLGSKKDRTVSKQIHYLIHFILQKPGWKNCYFCYCIMGVQKSPL